MNPIRIQTTKPGSNPAGRHSLVTEASVAQRLKTRLVPFVRAIRDATIFPAKQAASPFWGRPLFGARAHRQLLPVDVPLEPFTVGLRQVGQIWHNPAVLLGVDQELAIPAEIHRLALGPAGRKSAPPGV